MNKNKKIIGTSLILLILIGMIIYFSVQQTALTTGGIIGPTTIQPGQTYSYQINLEAPNYVDSNYNDGDYSEQYGYWGLIDSSGNVYASSDPISINKTFISTATFTAPSKHQNQYTLTAIIDEIDYTYDYKTLSWSHTEKIIVKKGLDIKTSLPAPSKILPASFLNIIKNIFGSIVNFFGGLFK
ncbi:MAG: hypothetical protein GXO79_11500 [Chlorobi bacterium]|nr:hypothetical protein [Chlorobiota bacterium]